MPASRIPLVLHRLLRVSAASSVLVLGACLETSAVEESNQYASLTVRATGSGSGPFTATPTLTFFQSVEQNLPDSRTVADNCGVFAYSPDIINPGDLAGGDAIPLRVASENIGSLTVPIGVNGVYVLEGGQSFDFTPGDTLVMTTPGVPNGFPAGEIAVRLAEPVQLGPLGPVEVGVDFPVNWDSEGDENSGVIVALRHALGPASDRADQQLLCIVRDNGRYTVPAGLMGEFTSSPREFRELSVLRWRTNRNSLNGTTDMYVVSTSDTIVSLADSL